MARANNESPAGDLAGLPRESGQTSIRLPHATIAAIITLVLGAGSERYLGRGLDIDKQIDDLRTQVAKNAENTAALKTQVAVIVNDSSTLIKRLDKIDESIASVQKDISALSISFAARGKKQ